MTTTAIPTALTEFYEWLADRPEDAPPTHRASVTLRLEVDLSAPPDTPDHVLRMRLLDLVSRFDREALTERVDYDCDGLLPGEVRLVGADAGVAAVWPPATTRRGVPGVEGDRL